MLRNTDIAQWIGGVGAALAAFVAVGVGWFQGRKTNEMWGKSIAHDGRMRKIANIGSAYDVKGIIFALNKFMDIIANELVANRLDPTKVADCIESQIHSRLSLLSDCSRKVPECHNDVATGSNQVTAALMIAQSQGGTASGDEGERRKIVMALRKAIAFFESASDTIDREYSDLFPRTHHSPSNNGTSAAG
jgi:hypothetical protein